VLKAIEYRDETLRQPRQRNIRSVEKITPNNPDGNFARFSEIDSQILSRTKKEKITPLHLQEAQS